ncbi:MAG: ribonuclease PH [Planctomycetota bacterium]|nr:MAG: ribonuclease PH [Planctomycetota bacterium]REJ91168.1 MAG: ribonuclease PH [Planctomycetota bacterium]REK20354.1 MAG: ribonuclease PH [Planctomycetota bacterium]REK26851.1 MAG: ribonuclease PH [Planctomycetota bacterium]
MRHDGRMLDDLRPLSIERGFAGASPGRVLVRSGDTTILCTASVDESVPPWKMDQEQPSGWVTAEYNMLPGSTSPRKRRDRSKVDGRTTEIQRLIGRSLRAVVDMRALGPRTITVDCDVIQADGGTRTLSITGGFIALVDAVNSITADDCDARSVFTGSVAAVSAGIYGGDVLLDLNYQEDSRAEVDLNVVMTGAGSYIEVQGTAERGTFEDAQLTAMLALAKSGVDRLTAAQRETLGAEWPLDTNSSVC